MAYTAFNHTPNPIASATTSDLCAILRVTPQTIRRMEQQGRIPPAIRVGRKKVWPAEAVAKLLLGTASTTRSATSAASQEGGAQ